MNIRKVAEPRTPLKISILNSHSKKAVRNDPLQCVIAQAMKRLTKGSRALLEVCVFPTVTVLTWSGMYYERYKTTPILRRALSNFDEGNGWMLPDGVYELLPVPDSQTMKAQTKRAKLRREAGDKNMNTKYPAKKRMRMPVNHRAINLMQLQGS